MSFNNASGALPASLAALERLEDADFEHNNLVGPLPAALGALEQLKQLGLGGNDALARSALPRAYCPALARIVAAANGTLRGEPACDLSGAPFACPLPCPALSKACGATCE